MFCTQCGHAQTVDAAFCPSCGGPVRRPGTADSGGPPPARPIERPSHVVPSPAADTPLQCPKCGLFAPAGALRCDCGYDFASSAVRRLPPSHRPSADRHIAPQRFASIEGPARWTKRLLIATAVLGGIGMLSGLMQADLISRAAQGISDAEATANDSRQQAIGTLQVLLLIATVTAFLIWFYRAHSNLRIVSSMKLVYTPGWAVGGFFVPFLNLVRPIQVMRELWHGTMSAGSSSQSAPLHNSTPALVGWWWGLFLLSNFLGNQVMRLGFRENPTLSDLQTLSWLQVLSDGLEIPGAVLAILLVDKISKRQLESLNAVDLQVPEEAQSAAMSTKPA